MRRPLLVLPALLLLAACGDPLGAPRRVATHGFRAHVTLKKAGTAVEEFDLAARGNARRVQKGNRVTLWDGDAKTAFDLDLAAKTATPRPFTSLDEALPGHPLTTGFSETEEATRRKIETYHRESDTVWAGHVCWIWRFEDRPDDPSSPSTTYWAAPDLDRLVMRVDRETPGAPAAATTSELTNVVVGADPELFRVPPGFRR